MAFVIREHPTNHYLVCTEIFDTCKFDKFYKIGKKIKGWWPSLKDAIKFEKVEEVLSIFSEITTNPKLPNYLKYEILEINE